MFDRFHLAARAALLVGFLALSTAAEDRRPIPLKAKVSSVQPQTGIVLWSSNPAAKTAPIQLEFAYLKYDQVVRERGKYDWEAVERVLREVAGRKHQAILRWHDTYVGRPTGVPEYIKSLADYRETTALSEKKRTGFPDWSHAELRSFVLEFFTRFSEKYDRDPRIAFVQVGFGLWAEYHIYEGPLKLGETFPSREFQREFALHLGQAFAETPWMISVDAAGNHAPFRSQRDLLELRFGLFDDSFNHARHKQENEPNWDRLGRDRWKTAPAGGEFSFFEKRDQEDALSASGPHGVPFETQAGKFHVSFIIGDDQPRFQQAERIRAAGMACGYRFRVSRFEASASRSLVEIRNTGIAPIYFDAYAAVNGVRSPQSLRGLLPGEARLCEVESGGAAPILTIESNRLVRGQQIEFDADLPGPPE